MKKLVFTLLLVSMLMLTLSVSVVLATGPHPNLTPSSVEALIYPGESANVDKVVHTPEFPPKLDICLLEDETGSFRDDIANLQGGTTASDIYDGIVASAPDSGFAVAGFRDYGEAWVYRLISGMSPVKADWLNGIAGLTAGGGGDTPEAQYDAIVFAVANCGWRADPDVTRVLVVTTDAPFHTPPAPYINDSTTTTAALNGAGIRLIGLKASGAGSELNTLATNTGGSVQTLSSDGSNIASAILAGIANLPVDVSMASNCAVPISTSFAPPAQNDVTSGDDVGFVETVAVAAGATGGTYQCQDWALINNEPMTADTGERINEDKTIHVPGIELVPPTDTNELGFDLDHTVVATVSAGDYGPVEGVRVEFEVSGQNAGPTGVGSTNASGQVDFTYGPPVEPDSLGSDTIEACFTDAGDTVEYGCDEVTKEWVDTTPPDAFCTETTNPHGNNVPKAPGEGGQGQNQDGFYEISAEDVVWPPEALELFVADTGSGTVFGPFPVGTKIKYTEANGAAPSIKEMGGNNGNGNGQANAVDWHIKGQGDAEAFAVDGSGNVSPAAACLVPPSPK